MKYHGISHAMHNSNFYSKNMKLRINIYTSESTVVLSIYKLGYVKHGSTAFKVQKDGCGVASAARALVGPEGLFNAVVPRVT